MWTREFTVVYVVELSIKLQTLLKIVRCRVSPKGCLLQKQNILGHQGKSYGEYLPNRISMDNFAQINGMDK
jgi:hypothetical protein